MPSGQTLTYTRVQTVALSACVSVVFSPWVDQFDDYSSGRDLFVAAIRRQPLEMRTHLASVAKFGHQPTNLESYEAVEL